jgi:predicted anti-sigma-YlaC factor YlaD
MNCDQVKQNFIGYIERTIPIGLQEEMETHLNECHACGILYQNVAATYTSFGNVPVPEINPFFYARLEHRLAEKYQPRQKFTLRLLWKLQPIAATFLVLIGIGIGIIIGQSISGSGIALSSPNRTEVLKNYANDYNLTYTGEENLAVLMNNE